MITKPEKIKFETSDDIVDYISKGLPPTKRNYEKIKEAINTPIKIEITDEMLQKQDQVLITQPMVGTLDEDTLLKVCDRVYHNRVKERNLILMMVGIGVLGALGFGIASNKKKEDEIEDDVDFFNGVDIPEF